MQYSHHGVEHLGGDSSVNFEVLVKGERRPLPKNLSNEVLDEHLLLLPRPLRLLGQRAFRPRIGTSR